MATRNELFPGKWFKAGDIPEEGLPVRIKSVTREPVGQEQEEKPIVHFAGQKKALVLNASNYDAIADALDEANTDKWPNRVVELFATQTSFRGKMTPCVRAREYKPRKPNAPASKAPVDELNPPPPRDDEIDLVV
jgi:hypothetical protein